MDVSGGDRKDEVVGGGRVETEMVKGALGKGGGVGGSGLGVRERRGGGGGRLWCCELCARPGGGSVRV